MKRLLVLSRYSQKGASSRMRFYQFFPGLKEAGWDVVAMPLLRPEYLDLLYAGIKPPRRQIAADYLKRIIAVLSARKFDLVWIEKEIFPFLPGFTEMLIRPCGVPYIVDYDDAIFHNYDQHQKSYVRLLLGRKLDNLLQRSAAVTVGNPYLGRYCKEHGATNVYELPTVIDIERYYLSPLPAGETFRIGWIGSPSTTPFLEKILPELAVAARQISLTLVTVGASPLKQSGLTIEQHPWSESCEAELLKTIDIGIMPLSDTPFERGKCGYKLIQYMGAARPVVASDIGVNCDIVSDKTGFLVGKNDKWSEAILEACSSSARLKNMGLEARMRAENHYSLQNALPRLIELFDANVA